MRDGESGGSVLEVVRFANGRATWDRESNCVVYVGRDRLVMRAYDGRVDVLLPR